MRAVGVVDCHLALVVTKVSEQIEHLSFPDYVINAKSFNTGNNSPNKDIINTEDPNGNTSPLSLRCAGSSNGNGAQPPNGNCAGAALGQIQPTANYVNPPAGTPTFSPSQLTELQKLASSDGTYYGPNNCNWFNNPNPGASGLRHRRLQQLQSRRGGRRLQLGHGTMLLVYLPGRRHRNRHANG